MSKPPPKPISRRAVLQGTAAAISLPFLEAMIPFRAYAQTATPPMRLLAYVFPFGVYQGAWNPTTFGSAFTIPTNLASLAPYKARVVLTKGLGAHGLPQGSHMASIPAFIGQPVMTATQPCKFGA